MPTYRIGIIRSQYATVLIDAESEEEAERKYSDGDFVYPEFWEQNDEYIDVIDELGNDTITIDETQMES